MARLPRSLPNLCYWAHPTGESGKHTGRLVVLKGLSFLMGLKTKPASLFHVRNYKHEVQKCKLCLNENRMTWNKTKMPTYIKTENFLYGEWPVIGPDAVVACRWEERILEELLLWVELVLEDALHPLEAQVTVLFQGDVIERLACKERVILQSLEYLGLGTKIRVSKLSSKAVDPRCLN